MKTGWNGKRNQWVLVSSILLFILNIKGLAEVGQIQLVTEDAFFVEDKVPAIEWDLTFPVECEFVSVEIQDIKREVVAHLKHPARIDAGKWPVSWNGINDGGHEVPDGIYFLMIHAKDRKGTSYFFPNEYDFNPFGTQLPNVNYHSGVLSYDLPANAMVCIRVGFKPDQLQALCRTLVNWSPQREGHHELPWDGKDISGRIDLIHHPSLLLSATYYAFPEGTVCLERGIGATDSQYERALGERDLVYMNSANRYRYEFERGDFQLDIQPSVEWDETSGHYVMDFGINTDKAPFGWNENRGLLHEVKVFLDDRLVFRQKVGQFPFSRALRFRQIRDGDHTLVINVWDHTNRYGYFSTVIRRPDTQSGQENVSE